MNIYDGPIVAGSGQSLLVHCADMCINTSLKQSNMVERLNIMDVGLLHAKALLVDIRLLAVDY